jgi:E3 ubiquitin-protein ligase UBR4
MLFQEIEQLTVLEETTLSSDLSQGYSLKRLTGVSSCSVRISSRKNCDSSSFISTLMCFFTELMASFVEDKKIKQDFKRKLVGAVLNGYLSLRRSVIRTVFFRVSTCSFFISKYNLYHL